MSRSLTRVLATPLLCGLALSGLAAPTGPTVKVETGALRGGTQDGVNAFKGIPFAAPPVGAWRWRAPQPAAAWTGVRQATAYAPDCMQKPFPSDAAPLGTTPAEDCLYANVWTPAKASTTPLPVMVWIYGGGFVNGGASPPTYAGTALARQGIVVVSFNYRIGRFGTFAHPQLSQRDEDDGLLANYGFMDQVAALRWVQRNVGAFGGDPGKVTIIGESAGGMSVHALLTSPMTQGLFQQAVIQSGGDGNSPTGDIDAAEQAGAAFARGKGIDNASPQAIQQLRALPAEHVVDGLNLTSLFSPAPGAKTFSSPVIDGKLAVGGAAYAAGKFHHVPVMIGATSDDIGGRNGYMVAGARRAASVLADQDVPTWYYRFSYVAASMRTAETQGAGHASDIPFFFDTVRDKYGAATTVQDAQAGKLASTYLVNFVKHGDPNGAGLTHWPRYGSDTLQMLELNAEGKAVALRDPWAP
ncbi:MAG: carboxylesterase family protein [Pseudoxanthomonas sp.]